MIGNEEVVTSVLLHLIIATKLEKEIPLQINTCYTYRTKSHVITLS